MGFSEKQKNEMRLERILNYLNQKSKLMKTIKTGIAVLGLAAVLLSCDSKERAQLQRKVDSLNVELVASQKINETMQEVGSLIDSIDVSRRLLRSQVVEGTTYNNYSNRLKEINAYIRESQTKIDNLEKSVKKSKSLSATIARLKVELEERTNQIVALEAEVDKMHTENGMMQTSLVKRDSMIVRNQETIKVKEENIASLEGLVKDINEQNQVTKANLYYQQAEALELAAKRTAFAPKRKKETKREALELYKLSLSLGKQEAQQKIDALEKDLG